MFDYLRWFSWRDLVGASVSIWVKTHHLCFHQEEEEEEEVREKECLWQMFGRYLAKKVMFLEEYLIGKSIPLIWPLCVNIQHGESGLKNLMLLRTLPSPFFAGRRGYFNVFFFVGGSNHPNPQNHDVWKLSLDWWPDTFVFVFVVVAVVVVVGISSRRWGIWMWQRIVTRLQAFRWGYKNRKVLSGYLSISLGFWWFLLFPWLGLLPLPDFHCVLLKPSHVGLHEPFQQAFGMARQVTRQRHRPHDTWESPANHPFVDDEMIFRHINYMFNDYWYRWYRWW